MDQNQAETLKKIKEYEDKLWDAVSYISSDFCRGCGHMYDQIKDYEKKIEELKKTLE